MFDALHIPQYPLEHPIPPTRTSGSDRPNPLFTAPASAAPPLVSLTPAQSELPTYAAELDPPGSHRPHPVGLDAPEYGTSIPGFPIPDDARSIKTSTSLHRSSNSVSKVMRRLRGEGGSPVAICHVNFPFRRVTGLSRDYWMDDENCKECYDCKSVFTALEAQAPLPHMR
jgi:1-phosphatidylinositol-3-phosphate 5-kinase